MFHWFRDLILVLILVSSATETDPESGPGMDPNGT